MLFAEKKSIYNKSQKNNHNSNYIPTFATLKLMVFNDDNEEVFSYVGLKAKIEINEFMNMQNQPLKFMFSPTEE